MTLKKLFKILTDKKINKKNNFIIKIKGKNYIISGLKYINDISIIEGKKLIITSGDIK